MRTLVSLDERHRVDILEEGQGGFLGPLDSLAHVGHETWCSRAPRRALVAVIIRWETACIGTIVGPSWTGIDMHTLHARLVHTELGCYEGYRPIVHGGSHVSGGPSLTDLHTAINHCIPLIV